MSFTRRILEFLDVGYPHPIAPPAEDPTIPVAWADASEDAWHLWLHPGKELEADDRALVWREFSSAVNDVIAMTLPEGVNVRVTPPFTFPDGQSVEGVVRFTYPPPESSHSSAHWWSVLSARLPEVSTLMNSRICQKWPHHLAAKRAKEPEHIRRARQRFAQVQAIEAARQRVQTGKVPEQKRRGRTM